MGDRVLLFCSNSYSAASSLNHIRHGSSWPTSLCGGPSWAWLPASWARPSPRFPGSECPGAMRLAAGETQGSCLWCLLPLSSLPRFSWCSVLFSLECQLSPQLSCPVWEWIYHPVSHLKRGTISLDFFTRSAVCIWPPKMEFANRIHIVMLRCPWRGQPVPGWFQVPWWGQQVLSVPCLCLPSPVLQLRPSCLRLHPSAWGLSFPTAGSLVVIQCLSYF